MTPQIRAEQKLPPILPEADRYRAWQSSIVGDAVGHPVHDTTIWVVGAETEADPRYVVLAPLTHIHCG